MYCALSLWTGSERSSLVTALLSCSGARKVSLLYRGFLKKQRECLRGTMDFSCNLHLPPQGDSGRLSGEFLLQRKALA